MKFTDISALKSKKYNTFMNLCSIYNESDYETRKALISSFKAVSNSSAMKNFITDIFISDYGNIDIFEAEKFAASLDDFKLSPEEKHDFYAKIVESLAPEDFKFQLIMDKTRSSRIFYLRYGISLNRTFLEKHFSMTEAEYQKMRNSGMIDMLMKVYVYPQTVKLIKSLTGVDNVFVEEPTKLDGRDLATIDVLVSFTEKDLTEKKMEKAIETLMDVQMLQTNLFL